MTQGQIVTFYSYKGGVGRSFALANIATLLSRWGRRVLCVDWDLEAPGLHFYFPVEPTSGLIDLLDGVRSHNRQDWRQCTCRVDIPGTETRLKLLPAGRQTSEYVAAVQTLDWDALYAERNLGGYFEELRRDWQAEYDLVLIDSRTGITDIGAICTAQLPDVLVLVLTANQQSLSGVIDVVERAEKARHKLPYERGKLLTLPVISRFDSREEYDLAEQWKKRFAEQLRPFYSAWLHERVLPSRMVDLCTIPYVSKWSFGEQLAVLAETRRSPDFITYSMENIASLLALRLERTDQFSESPDSFVNSAMRESKRAQQSRAAGEPHRRFLNDVFVSHPNELADYARSLAETLTRNGLSCNVPDYTPSSGRDFYGRIREKLTNSQHCVLILGDTPSRWQEYEATEFFKQTLEERSSRTLFPVRAGQMDPVSFHPILANIQYLDAREKGPAWAAERILRGIKRTGTADSQS